ncbi:MAG: peptide deformylase [Spirochaetes bacterium]|jgi:peptide deformylase|nr:peptide deformylase [Spirochaetota bacterium]
MAYRLVYYGNETLKQIAGKVKNIDQDIIDLIDSMYNIMYREKGVGLAAPQVDVSKRIITIDIEHVDGPSLCLINPEIIAKSDSLVPYDEGCLSLPGISADIIRPAEITVKGVTPDGKEVKFDADGLLARVLQHEIDHLNGIVFIDHMDDYLKKEYTAEIKKIKKLNNQ